MGDNTIILRTSDNKKIVYLYDGHSQPGVHRMEISNEDNYGDPNVIKSSANVFHVTSSNYNYRIDRRSNFIKVKRNIKKGGVHE
jgi:hypothetical protein